MMSDESYASMYSVLLGSDPNPDYSHSCYPYASWSSSHRKLSSECACYADCSKMFSEKSCVLLPYLNFLFWRKIPSDYCLRRVGCIRRCPQIRCSLLAYLASHNYQFWYWLFAELKNASSRLELEGSHPMECGFGSIGPSRVREGRIWCPRNELGPIVQHGRSVL